MLGSARIGEKVELGGWKDRCGRVQFRPGWVEGSARMNGGPLLGRWRGQPGRMEGPLLVGGGSPGWVEGSAGVGGRLRPGVGRVAPDGLKDDTCVQQEHMGILTPIAGKMILVDSFLCENEIATRYANMGILIGLS